MASTDLSFLLFSFSVDSLGILATNVNSMISVQPKKGSLTSTEKPTTVQVLFRAKKEVKIEHQPVLRCQVKQLKGRIHSVAGLSDSCQKEDYMVFFLKKGLVPN